MTTTNHARAMRGFTLVELMVGLLIGSLVVIAAGGIYIANRQVYSSTESLGRLQENARVAFELMAREIREAAGTPCGNDLEVVNVLRNRDTAWWANFADGIRGYGPGVLTGTDANSDAIEIVSGASGGLTVRTYNGQGGGNSAIFFVEPVPHGMVDGDIAMVCDNESVGIFQVTNAQTNQLVYNSGQGQGNPGNCTTRLGPPQQSGCQNSQGTAKPFAPNSTIARLSAAQWYVAENGRGSNSLFRRGLTTTGGVAGTGAAEEIAEGVEQMQLRYLVRNAGSYVPASGNPSWPNVVAVEIVLTMEAVEGAQRGGEIQGTDGEALTRTLSHRVTLRNRQQ